MTDDARRFSSYADYQKTIDRIKTIYEATMHSYDVMYNSGREQLKDSTNREAKVRFEFGGKSVERPLKVVTHHARDVYPQLLRSTLLVRVVAGYEAFLVDMVAEVSRRSDTPFASEGRIDMSYAELLQIDQTSGVRAYIVNKGLRGLTSGGIEEIRRFYQKRLSFDIVAKTPDYEKIAEIHQRRHLYVHRGGRADGQYIRKFKPAGLGENQVIPVPEDYFLASIALLRSSGLHIKAEMEQRYPARLVHRYTKGGVELPADPEVVLAISFDVQDEQRRLRIFHCRLVGSFSRTWCCGSRPTAGASEWWSHVTAIHPASSGRCSSPSATMASSLGSTLSRSGGDGASPFLNRCPARAVG